MGSIIMHLGISNIIKQKYNLSNKFLLGSINPDIEKRITGEKRKTHYIIDEIYMERYVKRLPDLLMFERENIDSLKIKDEYILGCYAHLIEDFIWFNYFVPRYVLFFMQDKEKCLCVKNNQIIDSKYFSKIMYNDYITLENYILNKCNIKKEVLLNIILKEEKDELRRKIINEEFSKYIIDSTIKDHFLNEKEIDEYFELSIKMVEEKFYKFI